MSTFFGRAPALALLLCAACSSSTSTSTSGAGGGGGGGGATATSSSSAAGTGGSTPGTMDCQLAITGASADANIDITAFSSPPGQGAEKHPQTGPFQYGFAASATANSVIRLLNIGVGGPMLTQGMSYSTDEASGGIVLLTINDLNTTAGERDWTAAPGSMMTVDAITPGVVSGYRNVTFGLTDLVMQVDTSLGSGNKATGSFKMSGKCTGAVTNYQGP